MKRYKKVLSIIQARRERYSSNKHNRKMLVESLEGRSLLAAIDSVASLPDEAGKLLVTYSISTPSTVPIVFRATQSVDDISSADDTVLLTKTVDPSSLGTGTFQVDFGTNFSLADESFLIFTTQDQGATSISSSKIFLNDFYVTTDGVVNVFGSNSADNVTVANDDSVGKFTVSNGAIRPINSSSPIRGFHARLYAGGDQFSSTINSIVASALTRLSIFAGPDNDTITTYSSNMVAVGGGGVDSIVIMGTQSSDQVDVSSQGVMLGGEKRLSMTQFEKLQLDTGEGDDFVVVNSLPAGITPYFIYNSGTGAVTTSATNDFILQMGAGRDSLKFTAPSTAGNPGSLPWPRIWNAEAIDVSGTSISKLITGGPSLFSAFGTTVERDKLEDLDLRYNQFNLADSAGLQASWALMRSDVPQLKNLLLHGNLNMDTANLYELRRLWYYIDLPPVGVQQAENRDTQSTVISSLVAALHWNPLKIFEYVRNRIAFEPYYGRKKSPIAVIQSGTGNDYDTANLLRELLIASSFTPSAVQFVQTQSENGSYLYMDHEYIRNWLGTMPASESRKESYSNYFKSAYQPAGVSQPLRARFADPTGFAFDNLWLEVNDAGVKRLNPSIKQHATSSAQQQVLDQLNSRLGRNYASFGELLAEQVPLNPISLTKLTGTANAVSNSTTVLGTSTTFTTQLAVGDEIRIGSSYSKVTAVTSATQITVTPSITAAAGSIIYKLPPGQPAVSNDTGFISPYVENPDGYYSLENGDIRKYGVVEWYERRVNDWLAENAPGISLADIRRQSPILAAQVKSISDLWPQYVQFAQVSNNTVSFTSSPLVSSWASPASTDFWKIQVLAKYGTGSTQNWWSAPVSYNTADIDQDQLYVRMNGTVPHLFRKIEGGSPVQQSTSISPVPIATSFTVQVTSIAPTRGANMMRPNLVFASTANAIAAGKSNVVAIGVDIGQNSEQLVAKLQLQTNLDQNVGLEQAATVAANMILTSYNADKVGTFVSMVGSVYRRNAARDRESIDGLFGTKTLIGVNVGFFSGFQDVYAGNIDVQKPNPLRITDLTIDLKGQEVGLFTANPISTNVAETSQESTLYAKDYRTSFILYATQTSALEHLVMEELTDIDAYSTVKLLQIAKKNNVNIIQFNNKASWDAYKLANPAGTNIVTQSSYASIDAEYTDPDITKHPETILLPSTNLTVAANVSVYPTTAASSWTGNGYVVQSQRLTGTSSGFKIVDKNGVAHGGKPTNFVFATPAPAVSNISSFINSVADPVNPMTGAFFDDVTDISLPSIGLPLHFSRHYDSLTATYATTDRKGGLRDLGDGWWHNYSDRLNIGTSNIEWITSQGQVFTITNPATPTADYVVPKSLKGQFWKQVSGTITTYHYRDRSGLERVFNNLGKQIRIEDQFGNYLELAYDTSTLDPYGGGLLKYVRSVPRTDSFTADTDATIPIGITYDTLQFDYVAGSNRIATIKIGKYVSSTSVSPLEDGVTFTSNATTTVTSPVRYKLTSAKSRNTQLAVGVIRQQRTDYTYYDNGSANSRFFNKIKSIQRFDEAVETPTSTTSMDYYANGRIFRVTDPSGNRQHFTYDVGRSQTIFVDESNNPTRYYFDSKGNDAGTRYADGARTVKSWSPTLEHLNWQRDEGNTVTSYTYSNSPYDLVQSIDTQEYTKRYGTITGTARLTTLYTEQYAYSDQTQSRPTSQGATTNRLLVSQLDKSTTRDQSGAMVTTWNLYAPNVVGTVTLAPLLTKVLRGVSTNAGSFSSAETVTAFTRLPNGLVTQKLEGLWDSVLSTATYSPDSSPVQEQEIYSYNAAGLLTRKVSRVPNSTLTGTQDITEKYRYNVIGVLEKTIDGLGVATINTLDALGLVSSTQLPATTSLTAATTSYEYNRRGNVVRAVDALGRVVSTSFDKNQRPTSKILSDGSLIRSVYDPTGHVLFQTDELGRITQSVYDERYRLIQVINPDGTTRTMTYDGRGNQVGSTEYIKPYGYIDANSLFYTREFQRETLVDYNRYGQAIRTIASGPDGQSTNPWIAIPITNSSFETMPAGLAVPTDGTSTADRTDIPGWLGTGKILNPKAMISLSATDGSYAFRGASERTTVAQLNTQTISQNILDGQNNAVILEPNTTYKIEVDIGSAVGGGQSFVVSLWAGTSLVASTSNTQQPLSAKDYRTVVLYYSTSAMPRTTGAITIPGGGLKISLTGNTGGNGVSFDNVRFWKQTTVDLNSTETHSQYTSSGQLFSTVDSRIHVSPWQNASNPFDVNVDGLINGSDVTAVQDAINSLVYTSGSLLPKQKSGTIFPDVNGDGLLTQADFYAVDARVNGTSGLAGLYDLKTIDPVNGTSLKYDRLGRVVEKKEPNGTGLTVSTTEVSARQVDSGVVSSPKQAGLQVAWTNSAQASSELWQTLSTTLVASTHYELQIDVGAQSRYGSGTAFNLANFAIELWAGTTLLATRNHSSVSVIEGDIASVTVAYDSPSIVSGGQNLKVRLTSNNAVSGGRVFFDNVRLNATSLFQPLGSSPTTSVTIVNPSFEQDLFGGISTMNSTITGWQVSGFGLFKPSSGDFSVPTPVWRYGYNRPIESRLSLPLVNRASVTVVQDPLGRISLSTSDGRGRGLVDRNLDIAGNIVRYTSKTFDAADRLITSVAPQGFETGNPNAYTTSYGYDTRGQLISIDEPDTVGPLGETLTHVSTNTYDQVGNMTVTQVTDSIGAQVQRIFDSRNRMTEVRRRVQVSPVIVDQTIKTIYDRVGNVVQSIDPLDRVNRTYFDLMNRPYLVFNALGSSASTTYTTSGQVATTTDYSGVQTKTYFDRLDRPIFQYDTASNLASKTNFDASGQVVSSAKGQVNYFFVLFGQQIAIVGGTLLPNTVRTTGYSYDRLGRRYLTTLPQTEILASGNTVQVGTPRQLVSFDQVGNKIVEFDPRGVTTQLNVAGSITGDATYATTFAYDSLNRLVRKTNPLLEVANPAAGAPTWQYQYDSAGNVLIETDPRGSRTVSSYDALGLKRATSIYGDSNGTTGVSSDYDNRKNLVKSTDGEGRVTRYEYDLIDRVIKVDGHDVGGQTRINMTEYDLAGNVTKTIDPLSRATVTAYDGLNRAVFQLLPSAATEPRWMTYIFDVNGNQLRSVDGNGIVHRSVYNNLNQLVQLIEPNGGTTKFSYDSFGNLIMLEDPTGVTSVYQYDGHNRRTMDGQVIATGVSYDVNTKQLAGVTTSNVKWRESKFDAAGNVTQSKDRNGRVIQYQYDLLNQNTIETWHATSGAPASNTITRKFEIGGQTTQISDSASSLVYNYDFAGRVSNEIASSNGGPTTNLTYGYTTGGELERVTVLSSGANTISDQMLYLRDSAGRVNGKAYRNLDTNSNFGPTVVMSYNNADQITKFGRRLQTNLITDVVATEQDYDPSAGRIQQIRQRVVSPNTLLDTYDFTYDRGDRLTGLGSTTDGAAQFTYDTRDQLVGSNLVGVTNDETFVYSDSGNRTSKNRGGTILASTYGTSFQQNRLQNDGVYSYTYDDEGNVITKSRTGEHITYQWDNSNRLTSVVYRPSSGATTILRQADMVYDGLDRLIKYSIDVDGSGPTAARTEYYAYDGGQIYLQFDSNQKLTGRYMSGPAVDQVFMDQQFTYDAVTGARSSQLRFLLADHQGSIRTITNSTGAVLQRLQYNGFGELISASPSTSAPASDLNGGGLSPSAVDSLFRYTGRPYFDDIDLQNSRARWYDAEQGRFISSDPSGYQGGGDYNLYRYVSNDPLNNTDPTGLVARQAVSMISSVVSSFSPIVAAANAVVNLNNFTRTPNQSINVQAIPTGQTNQIAFDNRPIFAERCTACHNPTVMYGSNFDRQKFFQNNPRAADTAMAFTRVDDTKQLLNRIKEMRDAGQKTRSAVATVASFTPVGVVAATVFGASTEFLATGDVKQAVNTIPFFSLFENTRTNLSTIFSTDASFTDRVMAGIGLAADVGETIPVFRQVWKKIDLGGRNSLTTLSSGPNPGILQNASPTPGSGATQDAIERAARRNNTPSPALDGSPYSPREVNKRQSELRRNLETGNLDPKSSIPDIGPGGNPGGHSAKQGTPHETGERNVNSNEEHSIKPKGPRAPRGRRGG